MWFAPDLLCTADSAGCTSCPGGQFQNLPTQSGCKGCPAGYYCPTGATTYYTCPAGYYCPASSGTYYSCAAGKYSGSGASACSNCPGGQYQNLASQTSCKGFVIIRALSRCCFSSAEGTTPFTSSCVALAFIFEPSCLRCPAGYYCPAGSTAYYTCPAGYYCPAGASTMYGCRPPRKNRTKERRQKKIPVSLASV